MDPPAMGVPDWAGRGFAPGPGSASVSIPALNTTRPRADSMPNLPSPRVEQMKGESRSSRDGASSGSNSSEEDSPTTLSPGRASPPGSASSRLSQAACEFCRSGHLRCDGVAPTCQQCAMRNRECNYSKPKRRGPKPGQMTKTRRGPKTKVNVGALVDSLNQELAQQKQESEQWKQKYIKLASLVQAERMRTSPSPLQQPQPPQQQGADPALPQDPAFLMYSSGALSSYISAYKRRIMPLFPHIYIPESAAQLAPSLKRSYILYAIFAHGARACGHGAQAQDLLGRARDTAKELFLESDAEVAKGHTLLAFYHFLCAEPDKATYFLALAASAFANLKDDSSPDQHQALILRTYYTPDATDREKILNRVLANQLQAREAILALVSAVYNDYRFLKTGDCLSLLKRLEETELWFRALTNDPASASFVVSVRAMVFGLRAALFAQARLAELAIQWAGRNTELTRTKEFREEGSPFCVLGLDLSAAVHLAAKDPLLQEDLHALACFQTIFPLATLSIKRLTAPGFGCCLTLFEVTDALQQLPHDVSAADLQAQAARLQHTAGQPPQQLQQQYSPYPPAESTAASAGGSGPLYSDYNGAAASAPSTMSTQASAVFEFDEEDGTERSESPADFGGADAGGAGAFQFAHAPYEPELEGMLADAPGSEWTIAEHGRPSSAPTASSAYMHQHRQVRLEHGQALGRQLQIHQSLSHQHHQHHAHQFLQQHPHHAQLPQGGVYAPPPSFDLPSSGSNM